MERVILLASNNVDNLYFMDYYKTDTKSGTPLGTGMIGGYNVTDLSMYGFINQVKDGANPITEITGGRLMLQVANSMSSAKITTLYIRCPGDRRRHHQGLRTPGELFFDANRITLIPSSG